MNDAVHEDDLDAAVFLPGVRRIAPGPRARLAETTSFDHASVYTRGNQVGAHTLRAPFRELLIVFVGSHVIGVAVNKQAVAIRGEQYAGDAAQDLPVLRP